MLDRVTIYPNIKKIDKKNIQQLNYSGSLLLIKHNET